jgi:hypothetical protein
MTAGLLIFGSIGVLISWAVMLGIAYGTLGWPAVGFLVAYWSASFFSGWIKATLELRRAR